MARKKHEICLSGGGDVQIYSFVIFINYIFYSNFFIFYLIENFIWNFKSD